MNIRTNSRARLIGLAALASVLFSVLRRVDIFLPIGSPLANAGWALTPILVAMVLVRMIFGAIAVLVAMPPILGIRRLSEWLRDALRADLKATLLGTSSYIAFGVLAAAIASGMGIYKGDWSTVFARPDIRPDPDVIGWGYFLLALVPGIWEELAFRGLILPKLQKTFPKWASILLSSALFALFHLTNLVTEDLAAAIGGVVMSFFFGLAWGVMTVRSGSVLPAMLSHYLVDSLGQPFLNVSTTDPVLQIQFFLLLTLTFPIVCTGLTALMYSDRRDTADVVTGSQKTANRAPAKRPVGTQSIR